MAWGFKAINNAGAIQVDGDFSNMSMFLKGGGYVSKDGVNPDTPQILDPSVYGEIILFPERPQPPLVAVQPAGDNNYDTYMQLRSVVGPPAYGGIQTVARVDILASNYWAYYPLTNYNISRYNWALFDQVGDVLDNTIWGMQVFNDEGLVMFDSRASYLEVIEEIPIIIPPPVYHRSPTGNYWAPDPGPIFETHTYNPNAWYVINTMSGGINGSPGPFLGNGTAVMALRQMDPTTVEVSWPWSFSQNVSDDSRLDGSILMCREKFI